MNGWADITALVTYNYFITMSVFGVGLAYSLRDKKLALYFFIISLDFIYTSTIHGYIKSIDPEKIYRYLIWSFSEFSLMTIVVYLSFVKNQINKTLSVAFSVLIAISMFALLYRVVDRHIFDLPLAYEIITTLPRFSNTLRVIIGYVPIIVMLLAFFKRIFNENFSSSDDDSSFHARHNSDHKSNKKDVAGKNI